MCIIATSFDMQQEVEQFSPLLPSYPLFAYQMNDSAFLILILHLYSDLFPFYVNDLHPIR